MRLNSKREYKEEAYATLQTIVKRNRKEIFYSPLSPPEVSHGSNFEDSYLDLFFFQENIKYVQSGILSLTEFSLSLY